MTPGSEPGSPSLKTRVVTDTTEAGRIVADVLTKAAHAAINARGRFTLAIPGGSSPHSVFEELTQPARIDAFPWAHTHLHWVDERAVPVDHADSNYGAFATAVLPRLPLDTAHVHRMQGELGPHDGARTYHETLTAVLGSDPLDAVLLGVGEDGHVASLFPRSASLEATEPVIAITDSPKPPPERITLTLPVLRAARQVIVLGIGEPKANAVARALAGERLPARLACEGTDALWVITD